MRIRLLGEGMLAAGACLDEFAGATDSAERPTTSSSEARQRRGSSESRDVAFLRLRRQQRALVGP